MPISEITEGVDMVLLTHNHIDHYEPSVKQHLPKDILSTPSRKTRKPSCKMVLQM